MPAILNPAGMLKQYVQGRSAIEIDAGSTVKESLQYVNIPPELVALVLVNGQSQDKNYQVCEGDHIQVIAIVGGG